MHVKHEFVTSMMKNTSRSIKTRFIAHIETWRPYTVIWCGLLSFTGVCLTIQGLPLLRTALLSLFIPIIGWIAGLYLSDYIDRDLDSFQKSHRPIPSKRMGSTEALVFGGFFALFGLVLTFLLKPMLLMFVFLAAFLVFTYAKYTKSNGFLGNINRGLLAVVTYFFGVFAVLPDMYEIPIAIILFSLCFFFHDMTTNIVGTIRDIKGDRLAGYQTVPVKYGLKTTLGLTGMLTFIWFGLLIVISLFFHQSNTYFFMMMLVETIFIVTFCVISFRLHTSYSRKKALSLHKVFVLERITLASAILFTVIDPLIAIVIYLISLSFTALFQIILRNQYEFNKWTL